MLIWYSGINAKRASDITATDWGEISATRWTNNDFRLVMDWIRDQRSRLLNHKAYSVIEDALDGEDLPSESVRTAKFILSTTERKKFSEREQVSQAQHAQSAPQVVYNINLAALPAPKCEQSVNNVIDISQNANIEVIDV